MNTTMVRVKGTAVSEGYAIGRPYIMQKVTDTEIIQMSGTPDEELNRFHEAREKGIQDLSALYDKMLEEHGENEAKIFDAHKEILSDFEIANQVEEEIKSSNCNCEWAVKTVGDRFVALFESMDNPYFRERALDMKDITNRLLKNLSGEEDDHSLSEPSIIVAKDLTPSETCLLDKDMVLGIITEEGGKTSHSAIIARLLNIPYVVAPGILKDIEEDVELAMSGTDGRLVINPDSEVIDEFNGLLQEYMEEIKKYKTVKGLESVTLDGKTVTFKANIGSAEDLDQVLESDAEAIGLFRTEFIYMNRDALPTLDEQTKMYSEIVEKMAGKPVTFRTLDIGGDKESPLFDIPEEMNPFLGFRGIRLCLQETDIFKTQLKAILIAALKGKAKIMFPMIASIEELRTAKRLLVEAKAELDAEAIEYSREVPVGMMIETPSSVMMADLFAKEVDFFSIGTNDLTQYTLAADRMNPKMSYLYSGYDPAVLRSVAKVTMSAKRENIEISICGELAADVNLMAYWLDCGIDGLSMSSPSIEKAKWHMRHYDISKGDDLLKQVSDITTEKEMQSLMASISERIS